MKVKLDPEDASQVEKLLEVAKHIRDILIGTEPSILQSILDAIKASVDLTPILTELESIEATLTEIDDNTKPEKPTVVGIDVTAAPPTTRPTDQGDTRMANVKVTLVKKSAGLRLSAKKAGDATPGSFILQDNQDDTLTVMGQDNGTPPQPVDISSVATLTPAPVSDNPAVLTADAPVGMTVAVHGLTPGTANLPITATWNDGSLGPFSFTVPETVTVSPTGSIVVTPGTPTTRP